MRRLYALLLATAFSQMAFTCQTTCPPEEEPAPSCSTLAKVEPQVCRVLNCPEHPPVLLVLSNGTRLRPQGETWDTFWASVAAQHPKQVMIDYKSAPTLTIYSWTNAEITCASQS